MRAVDFTSSAARREALLIFNQKGSDAMAVQIQVKLDTTANPPVTMVPETVSVNRGNSQIAHGISRVLRPVDL